MQTASSQDELLDLLKGICLLLDNSQDSDWSPLSPEEVKANIQSQMELIRTGVPIDKNKLIIEFLPTSTLQEIAMANSWHEEYLKLSAKFDLIIKSNKLSSRV